MVTVGIKEFQSNMYQFIRDRKNLPIIITRRGKPTVKISAARQDDSAQDDSSSE